MIKFGSNALTEDEHEIKKEDNDDNDDDDKDDPPFNVVYEIRDLYIWDWSRRGLVRSVSAY